MLRNQDSNGRRNWATHVKRLLYENGFGYIWLANDIGDAKVFIQTFKTRLKDCALQTLQAQINGSPKALYYREFKTLLNVERYLFVDLPYIYKRCISNFRCSGHQLMVEKGRHMDISREYRYCKFCLNVRHVYTVEDEYHMFMLCPLYNALRRELFIPDWLNKIKTVHLFNEIMSVTNDRYIFVVAKFLYECNKVREEFVKGLTST